VVGVEVAATAETLRIRTPPDFGFNPAACRNLEREWSIVSPDPSMPSATARRRMQEDLNLAFLMAYPVSLYVADNPTTDCMARNRIVTGVRMSPTPP